MLINMILENAVRRVWVDLVGEVDGENLVFALPPELRKDMRARA